MHYVHADSLGRVLGERHHLQPAGRKVVEQETFLGVRDAFEFTLVGRDQVNGDEIPELLRAPLRISSKFPYLLFSIGVSLEADRAIGKMWVVSA